VESRQDVMNSTLDQILNDSPHARCWMNEQVKQALTDLEMSRVQFSFSIPLTFSDKLLEQRCSTLVKT